MDFAQSCSDARGVSWRAARPSNSPVEAAPAVSRRDPVTEVPQRTRCGTLEPVYMVSVLVTGSDRTSGNALADHVLGNPTGVDNDVEVVLGDSDGSDEEGVHFNALRTTGERHHAGHFVEGLAASQLERHFCSLLAEFACVLPDRHGLRAERDTVESGMVAVLTRNRHGTSQTLGSESGDGATGSTVIGSDN